ncbi:MAG: transcription-repair coupling factor [Clostridia bacterium]|nr:transcription-repair coupling factor [Clostridia bacterium]
MKLSNLIRSDREFREYLLCLRDGAKSEERLPIAVNGLQGGARDIFLTESVKEAMQLSPRPVLIITPTDTDREAVLTLLSEEGLSPLGYKSRDLVFYNIKASHDTDRERLSVLSSLLSGEAEIIVTTPEALLEMTMPRETLRHHSLSVTLGDMHSPDDLAKKLTALGFMRTDTVDGKGQFSKRGDILDFWGGDYDNPTRIEFFGDEVDRLTEFDPLTQRTLRMKEGVRLLPAAEVLVDAEARGRILKEVESLIENQTDETQRERLSRERGVILSGGTIDFRDRFLGLIYPEGESLLDYLPEGIFTFILGTNECREAMEKRLRHIAAEAEANLKSGLISKECISYYRSEKDYNSLVFDNLSVHINTFSGGVNGRLAGLFGFRTRRTVAYGDNPSMLYEDLRGYRQSYYRVVIGCESEVGLEALMDALTSEGFAVTTLPEDANFDITKADGSLIYLTVNNSRGFDLVSPKVAFISMKRDEGRAVMKRRRQQRLIKKLGGSGERLMSYADLTVGDYIVHANYGIGLFLGIETVTALGVTRDYITIQYAGTDRLFVPCDRLEMIGKYIGEKDKDGKVKLSKMGGAEWTRTKNKAKSAARDIAKKLIELYARRQRSEGFAYEDDTDLEMSFADAFEFEETPSQIQAIEEIKRDMMKPCPMNRLLCGDVGFGKTEVALRAAFKAIMGGKQVAILVPTTILALQHYQTAISRFRGYPVTVEMLTRFKKPKEQAEILRRVKRGEIDIIIGTHKLFSKNLEFRDLGLLVVDEEQRFGVAQKERLKEFFVGVDVLTLTATPIPRTLNMAMNGISDISILDEAPEERRPVQTYVLEHDNAIITDAIRRELARGGQVLYLYNKIETIEFVADSIQADLPDARVAFAHGQMEKDELEDVWQLLVRGELDVLVCTTIIETGVDLPNANTLIIEDADRFGLAQLHQIRGRVGRSERQAYAYFTYRPGKALTEIAEKRLSAIREFAEFGAGFKIALRDLEIRGAGNLLGPEQHGYIDAVGYDLYCRLLNEAVLEEKGEYKPPKEDAVIDMKISAHIPKSYIPSEADRMEMYKKISLIRTPEDKGDIEDELCDRFGDIPRVTERLLLVAVSRAMATELGITKISVTESMITIQVSHPDLALWSEVFAKYKGMRFAPGDPRTILYRIAAPEPTALVYDMISMAYAVAGEEKEKQS